MIGTARAHRTALSLAGVACLLSILPTSAAQPSSTAIGIPEPAPVLAGGVGAHLRQSSQSDQIPRHPSELTYAPLEFTPPVAADYRHQLANGVVVYVVEDHTLPLVDISLTIRTGSYLEPADKVGLAGMLGSQMRAGGTTSMTASQLDEELAFLAARMSTAIGATRGRASLNCLTKDLDTALGLFFDVLRNPAFQQDRLDLAKSQALQAMERRNDSSASIERREWNRLMRGPDHFSTRPTTEATIGSITREEMIAFHRRYVQPGGFLFAVSGDVDTDGILAQLEAQMEGWPADQTPVPAVPKPDYTPRPGVYLVDKPEVNQGRVSIGHLGSQRHNPDRYALAVMNDILGGGGFTARLMSRIRSDEGLAYSVGSSFGLGLYYDGVFRTAFQSKSPSVARATAIVMEEIEGLRSETVSEEELRDSKASFVETFTRNFASAAATANLFANDEYTGQDPDYWATYRERIDAVTAADVLRVAREYLHPDRLVVLVVGNLDDILAGDPDYPEYAVERLSPNGEVERLSLPDPMTMKYPPGQR
ncbi:MAG: M16 family metallopeptidase [Acidobacteriota bacterium]